MFGSLFSPYLSVARTLKWAGSVYHDEPQTKWSKWRSVRLENHRTYDGFGSKPHDWLPRSQRFTKHCMCLLVPPVTLKSQGKPGFWAHFCVVWLLQLSPEGPEFGTGTLKHLSSDPLRCMAYGMAVWVGNMFGMWTEGYIWNHVDVK